VDPEDSDQDGATTERFDAASFDDRADFETEKFEAAHLETPLEPDEAEAEPVATADEAEEPLGPGAEVAEEPQVEVPNEQRSPATADEAEEPLEPQAEVPEEPKAEAASQPETETEPLAAAEQPEAEIPEEPEAEATVEPEAEAPEEPEAGAGDEPKAEPTDKPEESLEPEAEVPEEPEAEVAEEPHVEAPEAEASEEPEAGADDEPKAEPTDKPEESLEPEAEAPEEPEAEAADEPKPPATADEPEGPLEPETEVAEEPRLEAPAEPQAKPADEPETEVADGPEPLTEVPEELKAEAASQPETETEPLAAADETEPLATAEQPESETEQMEPSGPDGSETEGLETGDPKADQAASQPEPEPSKPEPAKTVQPFIRPIPIYPVSRHKPRHVATVSPETVADQPTQPEPCYPTDEAASPSPPAKPATTEPAATTDTAPAQPETSAGPDREDEESASGKQTWPATVASGIVRSDEKLPEWDDAVAPVPATGPANKSRAKRHSRDVRPRRRQIAWLVAACLVLVGLAGAGAVYTNTYSGDKAAPGVTLGGIDVSGLTSQDIAEQAAARLRDLRFTLTQDGQSVHATAQDLGVSADPQLVARKAIDAAAGQPFWRRLNPWVPKAVPLATQLNQEQLGQFLEQSFISENEATKDASAEFNPETGTFDVVPSITGIKIDPSQVADAVTAYLADTTAPNQLDVTAESNPPAISDSAARRAVTQATAALDRVITFSNGLTGNRARTFQLPSDLIGQWTVFTPNTESGELEVSYNEALISQELPAVLHQEVAIPAQNQVTLLYPGTTQQIGVSQWGIDGLKVSDPPAIVQQVTNALVAGQDVAIDVPLVDDPHESETREPPSNYDEPHGAKWIDVNRSTFWATLYEGTTPVGSYVISIGKRSTPTPTGVFYVYLKYEHQIMRGPESDPYESPTQWVSYFTGGVAFHSAPWNEPNNWQRGVSHGCVNMKTRDARTVFDFAPVGTKVVVHD
jgi:hypothetical protein